MTPRIEIWFSLAMALTMWTGSVAAQSEPDDSTRSAARELGLQGIEAYQAGDYAGANRKLEKAYRVFSTPTLALWSARARMQLGQWVEAAERYREALRVSAAVGDSVTQKQAQKDAETELNALLQRIPALTVELQGSDESTATLTVDGKQLSNELFGVRVPLNPGTHRVAVSRGNQRVEAEVKLAEKEHKNVPMRLAAAPAPAPVPVPSVAVKPAPPSQPTVAVLTTGDNLTSNQSVSERESSSSALRPLAITAMALGGVGLVTSGITALMAQGKCSGGTCATVADQEEYDPLRTTSTVTFWAGAALAAGGIIAWIAGPKPETAEPRALSWNITPTGVSIQGSL